MLCRRQMLIPSLDRLNATLTSTSHRKFIDIMKIINFGKNKFYFLITALILRPRRWWQNWAAEGGIGAAGEASPSHTVTRYVNNV